MNSGRSSGDFSYNSTVTYTCDDGFEVSPNVTDPQTFNITCGTDGTWDTLQECIGVYDIIRVDHGINMFLYVMNDQ